MRLVNKVESGAGRKAMVGAACRPQWLKNRMDIGRARQRPEISGEEGDLGLFETGAIVFPIAERHAGRLPAEANTRARAIPWMFAAGYGGAADPPQRSAARLQAGFRRSDPE